MPVGYMKQIMYSDWLPEEVRWADGLNQYPAILNSCLVSKAYILSNNMWSSCYKYFGVWHIVKKKNTLRSDGQGTPSPPQDFSLEQPLESVVFDERCPLYPVTEIVMHNWTFQ